MPLKEFEEKQLDWWCNFYRTSSKDLAVRDKAIFKWRDSCWPGQAMLKAIEEDEIKRDKLD